MKKLPTQQYLNSRLQYSPITGILRWLPKPDWWRDTERWNKRYAGEPAGHMAPNGHIQIMVSGERYFASRIIWKMITGYDPPGLITHVNGNHGDNRWENLHVLQIR